MERITLARALAMGREEARALDRDSPKGRLRSTPPGRDRLFIRAEGCRLWDDQGQVYLDFAGQGGTLSLGHNPAPVLEAVRLVAERPNLLQVGLDPVMSALMQNLAALAPGGAGPPPPDGQWAGGDKGGRGSGPAGDRPAPDSRLRGRLVRPLPGLVGRRATTGGDSHGRGPRG